jgi:hypothetical protein
MVADTSIRPMRSAKTLEGAETVIALLFLQIFREEQSARLAWSWAGQSRAVVEAGAEALEDVGRNEAGNVAAEGEDLL